jgi:glycosyltransferase involved in cell wall biosynthesis
MPRIAFGITELDPGGAERMLVELVTRLDRTEWEPHVYCLGPEADYSQALRSASIPVTCFGGRGWTSAPAILRRWTRELKRFQPDLLYTMLFHANLLGRLAGHWAGVSHVLSGIRVAEKRGRWHGRLDRWTNSLVERNVCVSRDVANFVEQTIGLDPQKTVVIPNGVDLARFRDVGPADLGQFGIPRASRVLISIGRLERQKGFDVLLEAAKEVGRRFPDVHFLIVGDGPLRASLEAQAKRLSVSDRVHWAGRRSDVLALLAASTALVLPSRWEGMPNVVLEAMAAGKPIAATEVEGVAELVIPGVNGWLAAPGNAQSLVVAIEKLLGVSDRWNALGCESKRIVAERFTIDAFVENHVKLFHETVRRG